VLDGVNCNSCHICSLCCCVYNHSQLLLQLLLRKAKAIKNLIYAMHKKRRSFMKRISKIILAGLLMILLAVPVFALGISVRNSQCDCSDSTWTEAQMRHEMIEINFERLNTN